MWQILAVNISKVYVGLFYLFLPQNLYEIPNFQPNLFNFSEFIHAIANSILTFFNSSLDSRYGSHLCFELYPFINRRSKCEHTVFFSFSKKILYVFVFVQMQAYRTPTRHKRKFAICQGGYKD